MYRIFKCDHFTPVSKWLCLQMCEFVICDPVVIVTSNSFKNKNKSSYNQCTTHQEPGHYYHNSFEILWFIWNASGHSEINFECPINLKCKTAITQKTPSSTVCEPWTTSAVMYMTTPRHESLKLSVVPRMVAIASGCRLLCSRWISIHRMSMQID